MGNSPFIGEVSLYRQAIRFTKYTVECNKFGYLTFRKLGVSLISTKLKPPRKIIVIVSSWAIYVSNPCPIIKGISFVI